tara:strand:+ start:204 stop:767 length:564 start_codon:yes stop_codon:yes gene_type:complete
MKNKVIMILLICFLSSCKSSKSISTDDVLGELGANPHFIIDEQPNLRSDLIDYDPEDITTVTILHSEKAIKRYGEVAKDGAVIIETKAYSTEKYQKRFSEISYSYASALSAAGNDEDFIYVVNGILIEGDYLVSDLSSLTDKLIKSISILPLNEANVYCIDENKTVVAINVKKKWAKDEDRSWKKIE